MLDTVYALFCSLRRKRTTRYEYHVLQVTKATSSGDGDVGCEAQRATLNGMALSGWRLVTTEQDKSFYGTRIFLYFERRVM
jgi:hypothetical protein